MGGFEAGASALVEPTLGYHPGCSGLLTPRRDPGGEQCQVGSLTGAVASQNVTEASQGSLRLVGNQPFEYKGIREPDCATNRSSRHESGA